MTADQLVGLGLIVAGFLIPLAHHLTTRRHQP